MMGFVACMTGVCVVVLDVFEVLLCSSVYA